MNPGDFDQIWAFVKVGEGGKETLLYTEEDRGSPLVTHDPETRKRIQGMLLARIAQTGVHLKEITFLRVPKPEGEQILGDPGAAQE